MADDRLELAGRVQGGNLLRVVTDFFVDLDANRAIITAMDHPRRPAISGKRPRGRPHPARWHQLKVTLEHTKPTVWRRLAVRGDTRLDTMHHVLQIAMGWTNSHLHMFLIGADRYSDPSLVDGANWVDTEELDERRFTLSQVVASGVTTFGYEYDFGDSWTHLIKVEKELPPDPKSKGAARCLDGARACPPEDCGGIFGFANLLKIIRNPRHKEYAPMMEWLGGEYDPEVFDVDETNSLLARLR
jgi:hypothetical protein